MFQTRGSLGFQNDAEFDPARWPGIPAFVILTMLPTVEGREARRVGVVLFGADGRQQNYKVSNVAIAGLELQRLEDYERMGYPTEQSRGGYRLDMLVARFAQSLDHAGKVEGAWKMPLQLPWHGEAIVVVSDFRGLDDPVIGELQPSWQKMLREAG